MKLKNIKIESNTFEKLKLISLITGDSISDIATSCISKNLDGITNDLSLFFETHFKDAKPLEVLKQIVNNIKNKGDLNETKAKK
jgi:hypothetical protein